MGETKCQTSIINCSSKINRIVRLSVNYKTLLLSLLGILFVFDLQAQLQIPFFKKLDVKFENTELNSRDTTITIHYNLLGPKRRFYTTRLFYSNNGGNSFKGPLRSLSGDIGDSLQVGDGKKVSWKFRRDNPYFDGKNIMFRLEAVEIPKLSNGGPINALRSLLIPGYGDTKVRNGYNYGWIGALTYASLGTGVYFHFLSRQRYNDYLDRLPNTEDEHRSLFNKSQRAQTISQVFFITGASIWLADVVGVYLRGLKNKRRLAREQAEEESEEETASLFKPTIIPSIVPTAEGQFAGLSLVWRF